MQWTNEWMNLSLSTAILIVFRFIHKRVIEWFSMVYSLISVLRGNQRDTVKYEHSRCESFGVVPLESQFAPRG